jgi:hypothetical protein
MRFFKVYNNADYEIPTDYEAKKERFLLHFSKAINEYNILGEMA